MAEDTHDQQGEREQEDGFPHVQIALLGNGYDYGDPREGQQPAKQSRTIPAFAIEAQDEAQ